MTDTAAREGSGALGALAPAVRHEPGLARAVGGSAATLSVAGPAQAFVLAGLATVSDRTPMLIVTPTAVAAERLANDLACFLPAPPGGARSGDLASPVVALPAWETLPF